MDIRPARLADLLELQRTNLHCLPENYTLRYYLYHSLTWPQLSFVATDSKQVSFRPPHPKCGAHVAAELTICLRT